MTDYQKQRYEEMKAMPNDYLAREVLRLMAHLKAEKAQSEWLDTLADHLRDDTYDANQEEVDGLYEDYQQLKKEAQDWNIFNN